MRHERISTPAGVRRSAASAPHEADDVLETLVLLGRSGSGKTTALKLINGMLYPTRGQVSVESRPTVDWDPIRLKRHIGYVIQEVGLFPHFTVGLQLPDS